MVFRVEDRQRLHDAIVERAKADPRIVAGAVIGSLAGGEGDRWSDCDLTLGVRDGVALTELLDEYTVELERSFGATHLVDLASGPAIYRVFLLPNCLQCDLSLAPASAWGQRGPHFRLLFGEAADIPLSQPLSPRHHLGLAVHHALHARVAIERGRWWQAEHWVSALRDHALSLACERRGLPAHHGRGLDQLPSDVRTLASRALARSIERDELERSLGAAIDLLLAESADAADLAERVRPQLRLIADRAQW